MSDGRCVGLAGRAVRIWGAGLCLLAAACGGGPSSEPFDAAYQLGENRSAPAASAFSSDQAVMSEAVSVCMAGLKEAVDAQRAVLASQK